MAVMPIEWGKIREYASATANARSEYLDNPRAPIPPTFLSTVVFWDELSGVFETPQAVTAFADSGLDRDIRRLLSLEQEYVFHGPLPRAGEVLTTSGRFGHLVAKQGRRGPMTLVHFTVEFRGADGALRAECHYTSAYLSSPNGSKPAQAAVPGAASRPNGSSGTGS